MNRIKKNNTLGFTLIEIIVVIAVISILATITIISYASWQKTSVTNSIKSDLIAIDIAMENARNFGTSGYPSSISGIFSASSGVVLSGGSSDGGKTYCVDGYSSKDNTVWFYIDSTSISNSPKSGTCASRSGVIAAPTGLTATTASTSSISIDDWDPVDGATGYNLQRSTNAVFSDAVAIGSFGATPTLPYISTGLSTSKKYYFRVQAFNTSSTSPWSTSVNAQTSDPSIATPSAPVVLANTVASTTTFSWSAVTCSAGQNTRYQYQYTIAPAGYDSGLVVYGSLRSIAFTTPMGGQTYTLAVSAQCYDADGVSTWSASGSVNYLRQYSLTILAGANGSVNTGINGVYALGSTPTITATPNANYSFSSWTGSTGCSGVVSHTITMDGDKICTANFTITTYTLTIIAGSNGTVNAGGTYNSGSSQTITATPNAYYSFSSWTGSTGCSGVVSHTITMDANKTCTANFTVTPVGKPSVPVVAANTVGATTTYSWGAASCPGNTARYQYRYTTSPAGYDSGIVAIATTSVPFTTSTEGQTYTVAVQAECYNTVAASGMTTAGSANYYRPGTWKSLSGNCGIASDNKAYCWGYNALGGVGDNTTVNKWVPTPIYTAGVLSGKTINQISSDYAGGCVIASDSKVYCWGYNNYGEIGNNTSGNNILVPTSPTTTGVLSGKTILKVAVSQYMRCVIASDNYPYCWGYNTNGEVGDNTFGTNRLVPTAVYRTGVLNGLTVKQISVALHHACVIASNDKVYCWGQAINGKLGDNTTVAKYAPVSPILTGVLSGKTIKAVAVGEDNTCVIASDNKPYCWGRNTYGQVGDNTSGTDRLVPTAVLMTGALNGLTVKAISVGLYNVCVIASDNNGYCWGNNNTGDVGDGTSGTNRLQPTKVVNTGALNGLTISSISHGTFVGNAYALASDKNLYSWGSYMFGSLGYNASANSLVPAAVTPPF